MRIGAKIPTFLLTALLQFALQFAWGERASAEQFLSGFAAMPLMEGFKEMEGDLVFFQSDEGSIVENKAAGAASPGAALAHYRRLLPQLGWNPGHSKQDEWLRDGSKLRITAEPLNGGALLTFRFTESGAQ